MKISRREFLIYAATASVSMTVPVKAVASAYNVEVNNYEIKVANLPGSFNGYKILHFTDIHYGGLTSIEWCRKIISLCNSLNADVIACTGDYVKSKNNNREVKAIWQELRKLKAKDGVYSVLGNHDHWADSKESIKEMEKSGTSVRHKVKEIRKGNERIWIAGAGDIWCDEAGLDEALRNVPEKECKIVLAHNPDTADMEFKSRIDLMLSGHTHGGQVILPFVKALVQPVKNKRFLSGLEQGKSCKVFISRGIGWTSLPIRYNCPPEIAVLTLRPE